MHRTIQERRFGALALGLGITLGLGALYVGSVAAVGASRDASWTPRAFAYDPLLRFHLVLALLIGYTAAISRRTRPLTLRDLSNLRPLLGLDARAFEARIRPVAEPDRRGVATAMAAGALVGVTLDVLALRTMRFHPALGTGGRAFLLAWELLLNGLLFALLGRVSYESLRQSHLFSQLGRNLKEVPLFVPSALAPFARTGLRNAAGWFVGSALASLLFLDAGAPWSVGSVLLVTFALGVFALLRPTWGVHRSLRAAKERELAWVRDAIAQERRILQDRPADGPAAPTRLLALLGLEARLEAVREWPFGTPTLVRFLLFLLLPLGSWLGGALVERLVDLWLR